jgi:hypothetical protein
VSDVLQALANCYGNNMPFAKRVDHTDPAFLPKLEAEIDPVLSQ